MSFSPRAVSSATSAAEVIATFREAAAAAQQTAARRLGPPRRAAFAGMLSALLLPLVGMVTVPLLAVGLTTSEAAIAAPADGALAVHALLALPGAPVAVAKCERGASGPNAPASPSSTDSTQPRVRSGAPRAEARRFTPCAPLLNWESPSFLSVPRAF